MHGQSWLDRLTSADSARDLDWLMTRVTPDSTPVYIYGGSYGTYLAQRFLQLFPERPSGVVLEGVATLERPFDGYDRAMNEQGRAALLECEQDPTCRAHFRRPVWEEAVHAVAEYDERGCSSKLSSGALRALLATVAMETQLLPYLPVLVRRAASCTPRDAAALEHFSAILEMLGASAGGSTALGAHVSLSELMSHTSDAATLSDNLLTYTVATGVEATLASAAGKWPVYVPDPSPSDWPQYSGPLLMLVGALDPATTPQLARQVSENYGSSTQTLHVFPHTAHSVIGATGGADGEDCAAGLFERFLADPSASPAADCVERVLPLKFPGRSEPADGLGAQLLGDRNVWGD
jgi:pimeloyl-ACP methyl ester carboxylesterase